MIRFIKIVCVMLVVASSAVSTAAAQKSVSSLQEEIRRAEEEIRLNTKLLEKTKSDQRSNASQLKLVRSRITNRKKIVSSLEQQISLIDKDISMRTNDVGSLEAQRDRLRKEYSKLVYESYKNYKLNNFMLLLFAAEDFNDASRRVDFMRRYNRQMEIKAAEIDSLSKALTVEIGLLDARKTEIADKRTARSKELASLASDQRQYERSAARLRESEKKISKELTAKRAAIKKAQAMIARIVAEESKKAAAAPRTAAQRQYDVELSGRFDQNVGKLPYPIRGGVIVDRFGVHKDPLNPNLTINNQGVDIAGEKGAKVYCVFEGMVRRVVILPGVGTYAVFVSHGKFTTVYAYMEKVDVKPGDNVATGQLLGNISTGGNSDDHTLHFEIRRDGSTAMNPEYWLRR